MSDIVWFTPSEFEKVYPSSYDEPAPLTAEEVTELDGYGSIHGRMNMPDRCYALWEREIMWGHVDPAPGQFKGLASR